MLKIYNFQQESLVHKMVLIDDYLIFTSENLAF
jgi:hypothetical protein